MSSYPPIPLGPRDDNSPATPNSHAQDHTDERNAINAVVTVLGPAPQGTAATVQDRLANVEDTAEGAGSAAGAAQGTADDALLAAGAAHGAADDAAVAADAAHTRLNELDAAEVTYTGDQAVGTEAVAYFDGAWPNPLMGGDFDFTEHPLSLDLSVDGGAVQHIELTGTYANTALDPDLFDALNLQTTGATWHPAIMDPETWTFTAPRVESDNKATPGASIEITNLVNGDGVNHFTGIVEGRWETAAETVEGALDRTLTELDELASLPELVGAVGPIPSTFTTAVLVDWADFSEGGSGAMVFTVGDGGTPVEITLDQDYGTIDAVVDEVNAQIDGGVYASAVYDEAMLGYPAVLIQVPAPGPLPLEVEPVSGPGLISWPTMGTEGLYAGDVASLIGEMLVRIQMLEAQVRDLTTQVYSLLD